MTVSKDLLTYMVPIEKPYTVYRGTGIPLEEFLNMKGSK